MKMLLPLTCVLTLAISLSSCRTPEKLVRNNAATQQWLTASTVKPGIDISGNWYAEDWGEAYFTQTGNHITGHIGQYPVGGVIQSDKACLAISEDGWTISTAMLEKSAPNRLTGKVSDNVPFRENDSYPIEFYRTNP